MAILAGRGAQSAEMERMSREGQMLGSDLRRRETLSLWSRLQNYSQEVERGLLQRELASGMAGIGLDERAYEANLRLQEEEWKVEQEFREAVMEKTKKVYAGAFYSGEHGEKTEPIESSDPYIEGPTAGHDDPMHGFY